MLRSLDRRDSRVATVDSSMRNALLPGLPTRRAAVIAREKSWVVERSTGLLVPHRLVAAIPMEPAPGSRLLSRPRWLQVRLGSMPLCVARPRNLFLFRSRAR
jgi:hypothetical protein